MSVGWYVGNANDEAGEYRGWLLGHFIDPTAGAVRTTEALEVKWGIHLAGHRRPEWTRGDQRSTLLFMGSGHHQRYLSPHDPRAGARGASPSGSGWRLPPAQSDLDLRARRHDGPACEITAAAI
jgi:hypothetical protein